MNFKKWLSFQEDTGLVQPRSLNNVDAEGGFETIRSKYMAGQKKVPPEKFDPDKKFGRRGVNRGRNF